MILLVALTLAVIPSLLLVWFFRTRDARPEPSSTLWKTFGLGVLSIIPTLMLALPAQWAVNRLGLGAFGHGLLDAFFSAALPEELMKLAVLALFAARHRDFDEPMDGLVYGVMASLGFATLENVLYTAQGGIGLALLRAFTAVPMHACCGAIMGYHVGRWRFREQLGSGGGGLVVGYVIAVLVHGLYDAPLMMIGELVHPDGSPLADGEAVAALLAVMFAFFVLACGAGLTLLAVVRARRAQREAVAAGLFAPALVEDVPMVGSRWAWLLVLGGGGLASTGALFGLVGLWALTAETLADDRAATVLGAAVLGLPPLLLGLVLFVVGLRKLPRPAPRITPSVA